jgi:predicted O-methyltransferase YrrM
MSSALLDKILAESPKIHRGETETLQSVAEGISLQDQEGISNSQPECYGIAPAIAHFLFNSISEQSKTLETGSGISTLVFALRRSEHIAITPNAGEVANIRSYAFANGISLDHVEFVLEPSEHYLPRCESKDLDLVLIDGKHAFPWPIIDWFYTADRLKQGGILVLDDIEMPSVAILKEFLVEDPRWRVELSLGRRALAVRKIAGSVHNVAWHMQPYITRRHGRKARLLNALRLSR